MELPLRLQLQPSRSCFWLLTGGHILAGVAVCLLPLSLAGNGILLFALVGMAGWRWRARIPALPSLLLRADGKVELLRPDVESELVEVAADTLVWPWLVVLHLRAEAGAIKPLLLFRDSLVERDGHRRLRLWLRWGRPPT